MLNGVGVTALGVAALRAAETRRENGLVRDPYAELFVRAAPDPGPEVARAWAARSVYVGVRSRFFDRLLGAAAASGVGQVVLLAAGLDTRALRLDWPTGTVVYEVDRQEVLGFKDEVLAEAGVDPPSAAARRLVPVDLREDWPGALRETGFDPSRPCAWLAEGLLPYLSPLVEADVLERVRRLSAPGSRIGVEHVGPAMHAVSPHDAELMNRRWGVDARALMDLEPRTPADERLRSLGWTVVAHRADALATSWGRTLEPSMARFCERVLLLDASL